MRRNSLLITAVLFLSSYMNPGFGQYPESNQFIADITGNPINLKTNVVIEGSPCFPENYCVATLYAPGGKKFENIKAKFYLPTHLLIYNDGKSDLTPAETISKVEFELCDLKSPKRIFISGYPPITKNDEKTFYEVLDSGKLNLLKLWSSDYTDRKEYGTATIIRTYEYIIDYFVYDNQTIKKITLSKESLLSLFPDKKEAVLKYIKENKINVKNEDDLINVFKYYNSL